jgi:hypothetical protein
MRQGLAKGGAENPGKLGAPKRIRTSGLCLRRAEKWAFLVFHETQNVAEILDFLSQLIQHFPTMFSVLFPYGIFIGVGDGVGLKQGEGTGGAPLAT